MIWMIYWMIACMIAPIVVTYQSIEGIKMTSREFCFFLYGVFIAGLPFIYVVSH